MNDDDIELIDLGDALAETRQCTPVPIWPDSWFQWGSAEYPGGGPPQC